LKGNQVGGQLPWGASRTAFIFLLPGPIAAIGLRQRNRRHAFNDMSSHPSCVLAVGDVDSMRVLHTSQLYYDRQMVRKFNSVFRSFHINLQAYVVDRPTAINSINLSGNVVRCSGACAIIAGAIVSCRYKRVH